MSRLHAILKNTGYIAVSEAAKPALSFFLIFVISRRLGRDGVGGYAIVMTFSALFELIATAGLGPMMVRGIAVDRSQLSWYFSGSIGVSLLATTVVVPVMLLTLRAFDYQMEVQYAITLLIWTLPLAILQQHLAYVCEGLQEMRLRAILSVADTAGRLVIGVSMIIAGYGILGVIEGMVIARALTVTAALVILRRCDGFRVDSHLMQRAALRLARSGLPFLLMTLSSTVFWSANTLMLSKLSRVEDVGVYSAAWRITEILKNLFYSYLIVLLPMMSHSFAKSIEDLRHECNVSLKYLTIVSVPVATGLSILAPRIIGLIYGHNFDAAIPVLRILVWTVCIFCAATVFSRVLIASHNELLNLCGDLAALAINVTLGWLLIQAHGPNGAALATLVSLAAFGVLEYGIVTARLFKPDVVVPILRTAAASLVMAAVVYQLDPLPLALVIVLVCFYFMFVVL
jgi:O-antigen/teichoic acid export membrane protein